MAAKKVGTISPRDALHASVMAAPTQAEIARLLGVKRGSTLRNYTRSKLGVYVSRGGNLTDDVREAIWDHFAPSE